MRRLAGLILGLAFAGCALADGAPSRPAHRCAGAREAWLVRRRRAHDRAGRSGADRRARIRSRNERRSEARSDAQGRSLVSRRGCRGRERPKTYSGSLPAEPPAPPTRFTIPGIAVRDAKPATGRFPLVIVSHGYSNEAVALSWLTENLASKGYVVAAIRHADPPITDRSKFPELLLAPAARHRIRRAVPAALARRRRPHRSLAHRADRLLDGRIRRAHGGGRRAGSGKSPRQDGSGRPPDALCARRRIEQGRARCRRQGSRRDLAVRRIHAGLGCGRASSHHVAVAAHCGRPRRHRGLQDGRTRFLRPGDEQQPLPADVPGRRAPHRPRAGARGNASSPVGPGLVRGSGLGIGARSSASTCTSSRRFSTAT